MPTYEYACQDCGEKLEVVQSIHDDSLTECPKCGGKLRKLFGNVGVVFKGSGFYKTDSRESAKSKASASGSSSDKKSDSKTDSKADSTSSTDSSAKSTEKSAPVETSKPKSTS